MRPPHGVYRIKIPPIGCWTLVSSRTVYVYILYWYQYYYIFLWCKTRKTNMAVNYRYTYMYHRNSIDNYRSFKLLFPIVCSRELLFENWQIREGPQQKWSIGFIKFNIGFLDEEYLLSWWIWEILDKYPALVRYYSEGAAAGAAAAFSPHYYFLRT